MQDVKKLTPRLRGKLRDILVNNLAVAPDSGKRLVGDLQGLFSLRLTYQDRIVYSLDKKNRTITVHRVRTHYGDRCHGPRRTVTGYTSRLRSLTGPYFVVEVWRQSR